MNIITGFSPVEKNEKRTIKMTDFEKKVKKELDNIFKMLSSKNKKYGNSALSPARVFSSSDAVEQIRVRIDDKLTRIKNQVPGEDEDVIKDLIGYLILLRLATAKKQR